MKRYLILAAITLTAIPAAFGQLKSQQPVKPDMSEMHRLRQEFQMEAKLLGAQQQQQEIGAEAAGPTAAEVGDVDSFDKNAKFMGVAGSGGVYVYSSCDPAVLQADLGLVLGPDDKCMAMPNPLITTSATFTDLARIKIPGKTAANVIYTIANHTALWNFENNSPTQTQMLMSYSPQITIISEALNDPAAIDPFTGNPMNGSFTTAGVGTRFVNQSMAPGQFENQVHQYSRANTQGFSRAYFASLGLPNSVINKLFNKPMTIRLDARAVARGVSFGQFLYSARFLGN